MLLERAEKLTGKITRYQQLKAAATQAEQVRTRAEQIGKVADKFGRARRVIDDFNSAGVAVDFLPKSMQTLVDNANKLRTIATENPAELANPPFDMRNEFTDRIIGIADGALKRADERWRRYVADNTPAGADELLDALAKLSPVPDSVFRIQRTKRDMEALAAKRPADPVQAVAQLQSLATEQRAAWDELDTDSIPPAVIRFIGDCAGNGVPLTRLTDEVRDWLRSHELLGAFRIHTGSTRP